MNKENISQTELEMIKEYQVKHDDKIALYFYKKFAKDVVNVVYYRINNKFSSIPIERNDLLHLIWKSIKQCLAEFDETKDISLFNGFVRTSYQKSLREALKFLSNGQIILNNASSLEALMDSNKVVRSKNNDFISTFSSREEQREAIVWEISQKMKKYKVKKIKKIIYYKSLGCSLKETAKKANMNLSEVKNLFDVIKKIGLKIYKN